MFFKKYVFTAMVMVLSSNVFAYEYLTSLGGPGVTINRYFVHNGGGISLLLNENVPITSQCDKKSHVYIKKEIPGYEAMVAAALAAFAAGKEIGLHGDGCDTIPFWGGSNTVPIVSDL